MLFVIFLSNICHKNVLWDELKLYLFLRYVYLLGCVLLKSSPWQCGVQCGPLSAAREEPLQTIPRPKNTWTFLGKTGQKFKVHGCQTVLDRCIIVNISDLTFCLCHPSFYLTKNMYNPIPLCVLLPFKLLSHTQNVHNCQITSRH